ncbi:MAG: response regulator transcription factor [Burkholderiaceae bacterium]|nr:response regulator transcription factor [Burkholderiaceae bacterium]
MTRTTVAVVEDDPQTLDRLCASVEADGEFELIGRAATLVDGQRLLDREVPDILLTDLGLPDGSGLALISAARQRRPHADVMVVTKFGDERNVMAAIEAGATGYLLKDASPASIGASLRQIVGGGSPISPGIARHVLRRFSAPPESTEPAPLPNDADAAVKLTPKELDVLRQVAKGYAYGEIAEAFGVSIHTITTHIKSIYRKLSVRSRGEAVFEAVQLGLIRVDRRA